MSDPKQKLYRLPKEGMIAGVASGFAKYFGMDVTLMRLIFIAILIVTDGIAAIAYLVLAVIMPTAETSKAGADTNIGEKIENLAKEVKDSGRAERLGHYTGIGLIALGLWLLAGQLFPDLFRIQWSLVWPGVIVIIGLLIIARGNKS